LAASTKDSFNPLRPHSPKITGTPVPVQSAIWDEEEDNFDVDEESECMPWERWDEHDKELTRLRRWG
jgi:hypothetical protein